MPFPTSEPCSSSSFADTSHSSGLNKTLPEELILKILGYLSPDDLRSLKGSLPRAFWEDQSLWKEKCEQQYPHDLEKLIYPTNINWRHVFFDMQPGEDKKLDARQKHLFSLVKAGNLEELKKIALQENDFQCEDNQGNTLNDWARKVNTQPIMDHFYQFETGSNMPAGYPTIQKWVIAILHWQKIDVEALWALDEKSEGSELQVLFRALARDFQQACNRHDNPFLIFSVLAGNLELFRYFLKQGVNPTTSWGEFGTPTFLAMAKGHLNILKLLFSEGVDVGAMVLDGKRVPLLPMAAKLGHTHIVRFLLDKKAVVDELNPIMPNGVALLAAANAGRTGAVRALLEYHANINITSAHNLGKQEREATALYLAAKKGHTGVVNMLLKRKADHTLAASINLTRFEMELAGLVVTSERADGSINSKGETFRHMALKAHTKIHSMATEGPSQPHFSLTPWQIAHINFHFDVIDCMRKEKHDLTPAHLDKASYERLLDIARTVKADKTKSSSGFFAPEDKVYQTAIQSMLVLYACYGQIDSELVPEAARYPDLRELIQTIQTLNTSSPALQ